MAEKSMFFNSTSDDIREYSASDMAECFFGICPNGVLEGLIVSGSSEVITVSTGKAFVNGYYYCLDEDKSFEVITASSGRMDRVVIRLDLSKRKISVEYIMGTSASVPELTQTSDIYEISLAYMLISGIKIVSITKDAVYSNDYKHLQNKPIHYGTAIPSSSLGNNGDIYIQY